jgi:hypothetical protein
MLREGRRWVRDIPVTVAAHDVTVFTIVVYAVDVVYLVVEADVGFEVTPPAALDVGIG